MHTVKSTESNWEAAEARILATMSPSRKAAIASLIAAGEVSSAQHAVFMAVTRLIKLPG